MKKIIFTLKLLLFLSSAKAQLFSHLGNGLNKDIYSLTTDDKGNVAAVTNITNDTFSIFQFNRYDKSANNWSKLNTAKGNALWNFNFGNCLLVNDTIYSFYNNTGNFYRNALLRATASSVDVIANVYGYSFYVNLLGNKMVLTGIFDSIAYKGVTYKIKNQAWLDGNVWKPTAFNDRIDRFSSYAIKGDTLGYLQIIGNQHSIKRYTLSGYSSIQPVKLHIPSQYDTALLHSLSGGFLFSTYNNDTAILISGSIVKKLPPNNLINGMHTLANYDDKILFLSNDNLMYKWNINTNEIKPIYKIGGIKWNVEFIRSSGKEFIFSNSLNIDYNGINYLKVARINYDSATELAFDTVVLIQYIDRNGDVKFNSGDELIDNGLGLVFNSTKFAVVKGKLDLLPNYLEHYYSATAKDTLTNCLRPSFFGQMKSRNLRFGVTKDTLWFPFIDEKNANEVSIMGITSPRHRLRRSSIVSFAIRQSSCNPKAITAKLKVLQPRFCKMTPLNLNCTKNGDTLIYQRNRIWSSGNAYGELFNFLVEYDTLNNNIGDTVTFKAWIVPQNPDEPSDNYKELKVVLVYSYDPNRKYSIPEGKITRNLKHVQYHIDFENEGNDYAERVTIKDTLDTRIPVYEFQMLGASHPYTVSLQGNVVTWVFDNINLTPKKQDSVKSKGYVNFIARINTALREGDSIINTASIYFDYNKPIITNMAIMYFPKGHFGSTSKIKTGNSWRIFPNPSENGITIDNIKTPLSFAVFNSQGRLVWKQSDKLMGQFQLPTDRWSRGIYVIVDSEGKADKFLLR